MSLATAGLDVVTEGELKETGRAPGGRIRLDSGRDGPATIDRERDSTPLKQGSKSQQPAGSRAKDNEGAGSVEMTIRDQSPIPVAMPARHLDAQRRRSGLSGLKDNASVLR